MALDAAAELMDSKGAGGSWPKFACVVRISSAGQSFAFNGLWRERQPR